MGENSVLSVIMPVYNAEKYLADAVGSVLSQTYKNLEVICVNDCSKDSSLQILTELAKKDSRVKVINSQVNVGAGEARNLGISAAAGEYITFIDSDDTIDFDLYEKACNATQNGMVDEVVWGICEEYYNKNGDIKKKVCISPKERTYTDKEEILKAILSLEDKTIFGYQCNSLYRAEIIKNNKIRFEKSILYEDFFFNLDFAKHINSLSCIEYAGYKYAKRSGGSITSRFTKDYYDLSYRRINEMFDFYKENYKINKEVYNILGNRLIRYTLSAICRNFKKESGMSEKGRKAWFNEICDKPLYAEILPSCIPKNAVFGILKKAIMNKNTFVAFFVGRVVDLLR